ncbi:MAG: hypothetical protein KA784_00215 [Aquabacterium sp.]|nr:hypothetical protein [Aquabacterium sp.]
MQLDLLMPAPLAMVNANLDLFPSSFLAYLPDNLHVYEAFEREALGVIAAGYSHYSARTIAEVLRHTSALRERNPDQYSGWKLNGNHVPYLSRLFGLMHPRHANLFELREAKVLRRDLGVPA